ncbi:methylmalonyl-CoA mutase family protein [Streptomyces sp. NPDC006617]|uniref:methylmalonyl-CoA mutase family protein n=1 Tax=Streptomyces sp. NPDC006617 TaxID=3155354 RepID=UPI0033BDA8F9
MAHTTRPSESGMFVEQVNARYKQLVEAGATDLSVAFDRPTRMGHDSDTSPAQGEVGKVGVAIDSIDDMRVLFGGIPLDRISTSMTIDAPAALLLLLYQLVAEEQGIPAGRLTGTVQNDVLKEYIARGTYIFPPKPALRLAADTFTYGAAEIPGWHMLSLSGHHMAEAGASPAQEIAFTLADGIEYVRSARAAGLGVDDFAPRLSFAFVARTTLLEEVAKVRAARRIWARVMREELGARNLEPLSPRLHTRCSSGEGIALARMTDAIEAEAVVLMDRLKDLGGAVAAIEKGYQKTEIERSAHRSTWKTDRGEPGVPGANHRRSAQDESYGPSGSDRAVETQQAERLCKLRAWRDQTRVDESIARLKEAARGTDNVLYLMKDALAAYATVGEVCGALRETWGTHVLDSAP